MAPDQDVETDVEVEVDGCGVTGGAGGLGPCPRQCPRQCPRPCSRRGRSVQQLDGLLRGSLDLPHSSGFARKPPLRPPAPSARPGPAGAADPGPGAAPQAEKSSGLTLSRNSRNSPTSSSAFPLSLTSDSSGSMTIPSASISSSET